MITSNINAGIACHQNKATTTRPCKTSCVVLGTATTNSSINITLTKCDNWHAIFIFLIVCCKNKLLEFGLYFYYHLINILNIYVLGIWLFHIGNDIVNAMNFYCILF